MVLKRWLISSMRALASVAVSLIAMDTAVSVMLGHRKRFDWLIDAPEIAAVLMYFGWLGAMWAPEPKARVAAWFAILPLLLVILIALLALLHALIRFPRL
jgi:membrane associated rhomboid family serine protease